MQYMYMYLGERGEGDVETDFVLHPDSHLRHLLTTNCIPTTIQTHTEREKDKYNFQTVSVKVCECVCVCAGERL